METNKIKKDYIDVYKNYMKKIEFMHQFMEDLEIFNPDSTNFKTFLIQSFTYLQPDFHYLSFLGSEDIDKELILASEILQILPLNTLKKNEKLFGSMSGSDIFQYWMRFFTLFNGKKDISMDSVFDVTWENKIDFFKSISSTFFYLNYELPVVNFKNLKNMDLDKEIKKWDEKNNLYDDTNTNVSITNFEMKKVRDSDLDRLFMELRDILKMYSNLCPTEEPTLDYFNFFTDFINLTKNIMCYKKNLSVIDSSFLDDLYKKLLLKEDSDVIEYVYFIKKCNNLVRTLKLRLKD